jgi:phosphoribosyl-ATP pyrophosphohydrolase
MRFWETFSKSIFSLVARESLQKIRENSIETVLAKSVRMIDNETLDEMRSFVISRQTTQGGFADRGEKCDLYYSLFGCYVAEALEVNEVMPKLKEYVKKIVQTNSLNGPHLKCAIILYVKLFGTNKNEIQLTPYSDFLNLLSYYYSENYLALYQTQKKFKKLNTNVEMPCSVTSAHLILQNCIGKPVEELEIRLNEFYRKNGSYAALKRAPAGDLLSTGVALYALKFINSDIRIIKPDCLAYINSLYSDGGFCATVFDPDPDVEYTFYGLLALGALSE